MVQVGFCPPGGTVESSHGRGSAPDAEVRARPRVLLDLHDARRRAHARAGQRAAARSRWAAGGRSGRCRRGWPGSWRSASRRCVARGSASPPAAWRARSASVVAGSCWPRCVLVLAGALAVEPAPARAREDRRQPRRRHHPGPARDARRRTRSRDRAPADRDRARSGQERLPGGRLAGGASPLDQPPAQHAAADRRGARAARAGGVDRDLGGILRRGLAGVPARSAVERRGPRAGARLDGGDRGVSRRRPLRIQLRRHRGAAGGSRADGAPVRRRARSRRSRRRTRLSYRE